MTTLLNNLCGMFFIAMMLVWVLIFAAMKTMKKNPEEGNVIKDAGKKLAVKGLTTLAGKLLKK